MTDASLTLDRGESISVHVPGAGDLKVFVWLDGDNLSVSIGDVRSDLIQVNASAGRLIRVTVRPRGVTHLVDWPLPEDLR